MNSNLTDTYKKEVSDILARIGDGLGKTVLEQLKPSIKSVSDEVISIRQDVIILKKKYWIKWKLEKYFSEQSWASKWKIDRSNIESSWKNYWRN